MQKAWATESVSEQPSGCVLGLGRGRGPEIVPSKKVGGLGPGWGEEVIQAPASRCRCRGGVACFSALSLLTRFLGRKL